MGLGLGLGCGLGSGLGCRAGPGPGEDRAMTEKRKVGGGKAPKIKAEAGKIPAAGQRRKCLACGKPMDARYRPFCSRRCTELDLGRWFTEDYRIPTQEPAEGDEEPDGDSEQDPLADPS